MPKVGVGEKHIVDVGLAPNGQLLTKASSCLNQVIGIAICDSKRYGKRSVARRESLAAGSRATCLRPPSVLGNSKQRDLDHGLTMKR